MPAFIAELEAVGTVDLGDDVTPVVAVLVVVTLGEAAAKAATEAADIDDWNGEEAGLGLDAFNAVEGEGYFIEKGGAEGVGLIALKGEAVVVVGGVECGAGVGSLGGERVADEVDVDTILVEVFIDAGAVLLGLVGCGEVELGGIDDGKVAGDVVKGRSAAGGGAELLRGGGGNTGAGGVADGVLGEELELRAVGASGLGEGYEGRVFVEDLAEAGTAVAVRLIGGEEEELMAAPDGAAHAEGCVVGVVWGAGGNECFGRTKLAPGGKALIGVVLAGEAVEGIGAGLGGEEGLGTAATSVLDAVGVGLDADFLNGICAGGEGDDARADVAGDVEAIDDVGVAVFTATVGAGIDEVFRGVVEVLLDIETAGDAGGDAEEGGGIAAGEGKIV